jgi:hypothetical protein
MDDDVLIQTPSGRDLIPNNGVLENTDRMTLITKVHFEHAGEVPVTVENATNFFLTTQEQPYIRRLRVTEEFTSVDVSWLEDNVGLLAFDNRTGVVQRVNPTEEEKAILRKKTLLVCFGECEEGILVPAGMAQSILPVDCKVIRIRSMHGILDVNLYAFPK